MKRQFFTACFFASITTFIIFYGLAALHIQPISIQDLTKKPTLMYKIYKPKRFPTKPKPIEQKKKEPVKKKKPEKQKTAPKKVSRQVSETVPSKEQTVTPITELTQDAKIIHPIIPKYPSIAQKAGIEASVFLELIINEKGRVAHVSVAFCSQPGYDFEKNAIEAAKKLRFDPFIQNGTAIKVKLVYPINFVLIE
jgi:TonB family protein